MWLDLELVDIGLGHCKKYTVISGTVLYLKNLNTNEVHFVRSGNRLVTKQLDKKINTCSRTAHSCTWCGKFN